MDPLLGAAAVAGLAGAPHCLGMCGPFACAAGPRPAQQLAYHGGRIATYAALGALAGAFGRSLPGPAWIGAGVSVALLVGFSLALAGVVPEPRIAVPGLARAGAALARRTDLGSRVLLGAVNGLLPCGLVYAALAVPVASADPLGGALAMTVFGLGTVPALVVATLGLRGLLSRSLATRRALAVLVLGAGLWSVAVRTGVGRASAEPGLPPCHVVPAP